MRKLAFGLIPLLLVACDRAPVAPSSRDALQASRFAGAPWSEPVNLGAPVNSPAAEMNAALSPDELSLYFVSTRAGGLGGADIWVARRASLDSPWEPPVNLGPGVNGPGLEAAPTLSLDGHLLFFSSDRPGGQGSNDIYVARRADTNDDLSWGAAARLGMDVNTAGFEAGGVYLQSAEGGPANLYFVRGPNPSKLDIYAAPITADGETRGPAVPVIELNDANPGISSVHPTLRTDGREVFLHSNRAGGLGATDLWVSTRSSVHDAWSTPVNMGAPLNSAAGEFQPTLSRDARTLIFTSNRAGGLGNSDIWMARRQVAPEQVPPAVAAPAPSLSATSEWQVVPAAVEFVAYNPCLAEDVHMIATLNWRVHWVTTSQQTRQFIFDHIDDSWDVRLYGVTTGHLWLPTPGNRDMQQSTASGDFLVWTQRFVYENQTTGAVLDWPLRVTFVTNADGEVKVYRVEDQDCRLR